MSLTEFVEPLEPRCLLAAAVVKDIIPGGEGSMTPNWFPYETEAEAAGDTVYFVARNKPGTFASTRSADLWRTSGTAESTVQVRPGLGFVTDLTNIGGTLYFVRKYNELWRTDGTRDGTVRVRAFGKKRWVGVLHALGTTMLFQVGNTSGGRQLWATDGTARGTRLLRDFGAKFVASPESEIGGRAYFTVDLNELWTTDGTPKGTKRVETAPWGPDEFDEINDAIGRTDAGLILEVYAGTGYTNLLMTLGKSGRPVVFASNVEEAVVINGTVYFSGRNAQGQATLFKSDGTRAGTRAIRVFPYRDTGPAQLTVLGGTLFFTAEDRKHGIELWRSDGTEAGTVMVKDVFPGGEHSMPAVSHVIGDQLLFFAKDGEFGTSLWRTDGTEAGTIRVAKLFSREVYTDLNSSFAAEGTAYYVLMRGDVWRTDGTPGGTRRIGVFSGGRTSATEFNVAGRHVFFRAGDGSYGTELFRDSDPIDPA